MASISEVTIGLKVEGERQVTDTLKRTERAIKGLERGIKASVNTSDKNAKSLDRIAREAMKAQREMDRLAKAVKQGTITGGQFLGETNKIAARLKRLGMDKAQSEVMKYYQALMAASNASDVLSSDTSQLATSMGSLNSAHVNANKYIPQTKRQTNQLGVVFQQAGYQIGDFAVQVQSGTHYMVAMGQQLTQLVGVGAMLAKSTRWIAAFSVLGVIVPIITAIAGGFLRARDGAASLAEEFDKLASYEKDFENFGDEFGEKLLGQIEKIREEFGNLIADVYEEQVRQSQEALKGAFGGNIIQGDMATQLANIGDLDPGDTVDETVAYAQEIVRRQEEIAQILSSITDPTIKTTEDLANAFNEAYNELLDLDYVSEEALSKFRAIAEESGVISNLTEATNKEQQLTTSAAEEALNVITQANEPYTKLADEIGRGATNALVLAGVDLSNGVDEATKAAAVLADNLGIALRNAIAIMTLGPIAGAAAYNVPGAGAGPFSGPGSVPGGDTNNPPPPEGPLSITDTFTLPDIPTGSGSTGGGGGGGTPEWTSLFPELQAAYEEAEKLAKQYKDEVEILDSALENGLITQQQYNQHLAEAQEYYGQAGDAATEYEKILLMMAETTSDALGDAMMDIVTGTKSVADAFTDMTQIILKKAFELLVINPILNSIFGGIPGFNLLPSLVPGSPSANGNIFNAGNVQPFATGGVVGSPTYFPMANGQVGLMGEAGPEAIMPLKRGKGGRLGVEVNGEQGNVTINQTFAFSANGDDSVKKIIADEAPKIAALTQKQILDSRRRGGVVRDTFGR